MISRRRPQGYETKTETMLEHLRPRTQKFDFETGLDISSHITYSFFFKAVWQQLVVKPPHFTIQQHSRCISFQVLNDLTQILDIIRPSCPRSSDCSFPIHFSIQYKVCLGNVRFCLHGRTI